MGRAELRNRLRNAEWVIDLRPRAAFATEHVRGTVSLDATGPLATYLGWLAPWGAPVTLLGELVEQILLARRELARIGFDRVMGYAIGVPAAWARPDELTGFRRSDFAELATARGTRAEIIVLDVRRRLEWRGSHLDGARNIPLHEVPERVGELPVGPVWVHCASGFRAAAAASLLERRGREVVLVDDSYAAAARAGCSILAA